MNPQTNKPLSETYITHCHKLIKSIYNYAKKKKWILSNPADYVIEAPNGKSKEREYYSYEEMENLFPLLEKAQLRLKVAINILFNSGLRRGELIGLKWKDIEQKKIPTIKDNKRILETTTIFDINKEVIVIQKEWLNNKNFLSKYEIIEIISNTLVAIKPKTDKSIRKVIMENRFYDLLKEYKQYQINNGFNPIDNDYIFRSLNNVNVWNPNDLTREWNNFIRVNNLKKITIHDIRHSHATYLLSLGIPAQDVARRLGHSEPTTTLRIYTHSNLTQDKILVNKLKQSNSYNYGNNNPLLPEQILGILIKDELTINDKDLISSIEWLCNTNITSDEFDEYLNISKNYILENNPSLETFVNVINNLSHKDKEILFNNINDIFLKTNELNLNQINDIDKYNNYTIKI